MILYFKNIILLLLVLFCKKNIRLYYFKINNILLKDLMH